MNSLLSSRFLATAILFITTLGIGTLWAGMPPKKAPTAKEVTASSQKMQALYKTLADILTDVSSDSRFQNPANRARIQKEALELSNLAHDLSKKGLGNVDPDPTVPMVAGLLARETKRAAAELKRNNFQYARSILKTVPSYCIACHTRNASGPQFSKLPIEPTQNSLTPVERGEFYAASRQFDRAFDEFMKVIKSPTYTTGFNLDWDRAIHQGLAIAVRVKQDPAQAQEIVDNILSSNSAPVFLKEDAKVWKTSLKEWKEEGKRTGNTEEGLHAEAIRLMAKARETQKYPMDRTADIYYLRASAATHDLLQAAPQGTYVAEGLLLAGISYEVLSPLRTENLHDLFYEGCIRRAPHTLGSDLCYRRYEQSVIMGYTGSGGTRVSKEDQEKLKELRAISLPEGPSNTPTTLQ